MSIDTTKYPKEQKQEDSQKEDSQKKVSEDIISANKEIEDNRDNDGDGLTNKQELYLGTNKDVFDTDGDGIADGLEVSNGTNPLIIDMIKKGDVGSLKYAVLYHLDPLTNLTALRALSRLDTSNRDEYQKQINSLLLDNPSLSPSTNSQTSKLSEKLTQKKDIKSPQNELTMRFKNTSENE